MIATLALGLLAGAVNTIAATSPAASPAAADLRAEAAAPPDEPVVRVTLAERNVYDPGDRAHVRVHVRDDAHLVVLQAAPDGQVSVLYPRLPTDDDFVRGGSDFDINGPGGRESFVVSEVGGTGAVYAAVSKDPFHFDAFVDNGYWNHRAFPDTANRNTEAVLTAVVQQMASPGGRFDYDIVNYTVTRAYDRARQSTVAYDGGGPPPSPTTTVYVYNDPWAPWYDPWYSPWGYPYGFWPGYYGGPVFGVGFGFGFGGCWGCFNGGFIGFPFSRFGRPPVIVTPPIVVFRPRGILTSRAFGASGTFANRPTVFSSARLGGGLAGAPWRGRALGGTAATGSAVFANARLGGASGATSGAPVGWRSRGATVFPQVHSVASVSQQYGRVVYRGSATGEVGQAQATRVATARAGSSYSGSGPASYRSTTAGNPMYSHAMTAAEAHRVEPSAGGNGRYEGSTRSEGGVVVYRGGGGGGGGGGAAVEVVAAAAGSRVAAAGSRGEVVVAAGVAVVAAVAAATAAAEDIAEQKQVARHSNRYQNQRRCVVALDDAPAIRLCRGERVLPRFRAFGHGRLLPGRPAAASVHGKRRQCANGSLAATIPSA